MHKIKELEYKKALELIQNGETIVMVSDEIPIYGRHKVEFWRSESEPDYYNWTYEYSNIKGISWGYGKIASVRRELKKLFRAGYIPYVRKDIYRLERLEVEAKLTKNQLQKVLDRIRRRMKEDYEKGRIYKSFEDYLVEEIGSKNAMRVKAIALEKGEGIKKMRYI